jgi:hypothetical protein
MPPVPPSVGDTGNLDLAERQRRRDQYDREQEAWEREQRQARQQADSRADLIHDLKLIAGMAQTADQTAKRAIRLARQKAEGIGAKVQRGRRAYPIKEAVVEEADRRRKSHEPANSTVLRQWARKKFGKNSLSSKRTFRLWISPKRQ